MPANSPSHRHAVAKHAGLARRRPPSDADVIAARRDVDVECLAAHVKRVVDSAPPLSSQQRSRIAALLRPTGGAA
jgi:hypothetical protein